MNDEDFVGKIWLQKCGDSLFVIEKSNKQNKDKKYLFYCQFQKYPFEGFYTKQNILNGSILNPEIERIEFIDKICNKKKENLLKIYDCGNLIYKWEMNKN